MPMSAVGTKGIAPTFVVSPAQMPSGGVEYGLARHGAGSHLASYTVMRRRFRGAGFTLIELLMVIAIVAIATAGVGLALRDTSGTALEREAQRLAVLLEAARAQSRMTASPVRWRPTATGFSFEGLTTSAPFPSNWLSQDVRAAGPNAVVLGPEPVIGPQQIRLVSISEPSRSLTLATDGVRPFSVLNDVAATVGIP
jgi:general secretion pathway protein H